MSSTLLFFSAMAAGLLPTAPEQRRKKGKGKRKAERIEEVATLSLLSVVGNLSFLQSSGLAAPLLSLDALERSL